jgi:hypothetical protein
LLDNLLGGSALLKSLGNRFQGNPGPSHTDDSIRIGLQWHPLLFLDFQTHKNENTPWPVQIQTQSRDLPSVPADSPVS